MSVRTHCGTITIPSGSTTTINYTSCPFTPKAGIFFGGLCGSQTWNTKYGSYVTLMLNYAWVDDDGHQVDHHMLLRDNGEYQDYGFIGALMRHSAAASQSQDGLASHAGWTSSGFDVSISDAYPEDYKFAFVLFGGAGFDQSEIVSWTETGGNCDVTTVGFQGNILFTMGRGYGGAGFMIGQATAADNEGVVYTDEAYSWAGDTNCIVRRHKSLGYIAQMGEFSTWLSNGFRIYYKYAFASETVYGMVFKTVQGKVDVGDSLTRTDSNDINLTGYGWKPTGGQVLSGCIGECADNQDASSHAEEFSVGVFDEVGNRYGLGWYWADKTWAMYNNEVYVNMTANAVEGLMDLKNTQADGAVMVMDDTDPAQYWFGYSLLGPPGSPSGRARIVA